MSTIRTTLLSSAITLVLALGAYFALAPVPAYAASAGCASTTTKVYTTAQLQSILNGRFPRRIAMPY